MDDTHREHMERLKREGTRNEGERAMLGRYLRGEPEPDLTKRHVYKPNDQVLDDLIAALPPTRNAGPDDILGVRVQALRMLIAYARYGDTVRWHRLNQVPELSPLEELQQAIVIKINAMAARGELPAITGKNRLGNDLARETLAEKLAWSLDQAYVFAARVRDRA